MRAQTELKVTLVVCRDVHRYRDLLSDAVPSTTDFCTIFHVHPKQVFNFDSEAIFNIKGIKNIFSCHKTCAILASTFAIHLCVVFSHTRVHGTVSLM